MSIWVDHRVEERVTEILSDVYAHQVDHHFGRPYLTAYQLAIAFARAAPEVVRALGYQVGGEGIGRTHQPGTVPGPGTLAADSHRRDYAHRGGVPV